MTKQSVFASLVEEAGFGQDADEGITTLPLSSLIVPETPKNPKELVQPREYFEPQIIEELADTIASKGVLQPITVRPVNDNQYEVVIGGQRYLAAQKAGLEEIPVIIKELSNKEALEIAIIENEKRKNLNDLEFTKAVKVLLSHALDCPYEEVDSVLHRLVNEDKGKVTPRAGGKNHREIIEAVFSQFPSLNNTNFVRYYLPLLSMPSLLKEAVIKGQIKRRMALCLKSIKDEEQQKELLAEIVSNPDDWTLRKLQQKVKKLKEKSSKPQKKKPLSLKEKLHDAYNQVRKSQVWKEPEYEEEIQDILQRLNSLLKKAKKC